MLKEEMFDFDIYGIYFNVIWDMNVVYFNFFINVIFYFN